MSPPLNSCAGYDVVLAKNSSFSTTEAFRQLNLAIFAIGLATLAGSFAIFVFSKRRYARLRVRRTLLVVVYTAGILCYLFGVVFPEIINIYNFSCGLQAFLNLCVVPMLTSSQITRNLSFLLTTRFYEVTLLYGRVAAAEMGDEEEEESEEKRRVGARKALGALCTRWISDAAWSMRAVRYGIMQILFVEKSVKPDPNMTHEERVYSLVALRYLTGYKGVLLVFFIVSSPMFIFAVIYSLVVPGYLHCTGCRRGQTVTLIVFGEATYGLASGLAFTLRARKLPDHFGLFAEGRTSIRWIVIAFVGFALETWVPTTFSEDFTFSVITATGLVGAMVSISAWQVFLARREDAASQQAHSHEAPVLGRGGGRASRVGPSKVTSKTFGSSPTANSGANGSSAPSSQQAEYSPQVSLTSRKRGSKMDILSLIATPAIALSHASSSSSQHDASGTGASGGPTSPPPAVAGELADIATVLPRLYEVLTNQVLRAGFEVYLSEEFAIESLLFLVDTGDWKLAYYDVAETARKVRARRLVKTYIETGSLYSINIPHEQTSDIMSAYQRNEFPFTVFDEARLEVARLLNRGALKRFMKSAIYNKIISANVVVSVMDGGGEGEGA